MPEPYLPPLQRLLLAFIAFFTVLFRRDFALGVHRLWLERRAALAPGRGAGAQPAAPEPTGGTAPAPPASEATVAVAPTPATPEDIRPALRVLAALQREGRLVDFVEENLEGFTDAQIGAAARTVHAGCKRAIEEWFGLEPVLREAEGATVTVPSGFDPGEIRLTGQVVGTPPFRGALRHHGWKAREVRVPPAPDGQDPKIVAPAEVEL